MPAKVRPLDLAQPRRVPRRHLIEAEALINAVSIVQAASVDKRIGAKGLVWTDQLHRGSLSASASRRINPNERRSQQDRSGQTGPLIMSFQHFYGLVSQIIPSRPTQIKDSPKFKLGTKGQHPPVGIHCVPQSRGEGPWSTLD